MVAWTLAGQYGPEVLFGASGFVARGVPVPVHTHGTQSLAAVYTDSSMGHAGPNPVVTDGEGNLVFFAVPGIYDIVVLGTVLTIVVEPNPADPALGGGGGGVQSVVAGSHIVVNSNDVAHPIVALGVPPVVVTALQIDHTTPNLNNGVLLLNPSSGDILLDVWVQLQIAWNGTTPQLDVGSVGFGGIFGSLAAALDLTGTPDHDQDATLLISNFFAPAASSFSDLGRINSRRIVPAVWSNNVSDFSVWVSQDGTAGGADPGATVGEATIFVMSIPGFA